MIAMLKKYDIRIIYNENEEWFHVGDIGKALELTNVRKVLPNISDKYKRKFMELDVTDGYNRNFKNRLNNRGEIFVKPHAIYNIAFRSNKKEAKEFTEWVTEVIELIRHNGYYIADTKCEEWIGIRKKVKEGRKDLSSALKLLREYAIEQGSINYEKRESAIYTNYTKMLNSRMNIKSKERDSLSQQQLMDISMYENIQRKIIIKGIENKVHYKQIYKDVKEFINMI